MRQQLELATFFALQQNFAAQAARFGYESPSLWMGTLQANQPLTFFSRGLTTLSDFLSTYKRMQVLLGVNLAGMSEEDCSQENGNVSQFNQNALEHLDGALYL